MILLHIKHGWVSVCKLILFCGIFFMNNICESSDTNEIGGLQNVLFVNKTNMDDKNCVFPTEVVIVHRRRFCFSINTDKKGCCNDNEFNCNFEISGNSLIMDKEILCNQDIVQMAADQDFSQCTPSKFYKDSKNGSLFNIHKCLNKGEKNIRFSKNDHRGRNSFCVTENYQGETNPNTSKPPEQELCPDPSIECVTGTETNLEAALNIIKNISSVLEQMTNCRTGAIKKGEIRGIITKLPPKDPTSVNIGITSTNISIVEDNIDSSAGMLLLVQVSKEATEMAVKKNGSFLGFLLIPRVFQDVNSSSILNNEVVGIEMGAEISNLSQTIDIQFRNVDKKGKVASCRSWDGKGKDPIWTEDGCHLKETNESITCQCSHLTFFAILLSPPPGNISSSHLRSLTHITSVGCGLSMFFLAAAIFMHCLIRRGKASQATQILMNLFVAMFNLNLSFLINDKIANLGNFGACVAIAAFMHYTMLATLTWFFMEALHLYFTLGKLQSEIKLYMGKLCVMGWVTPAVVVIPLLALRKYNYLVISADDGTSAKMCWIPDAAVHQGVNIGYYAIVFIFTFTIFILTVRKIFPLKARTGKTTGGSSIKTNTFSILGLFLLLGITWAFAFFSHGPLLVASYYIFTILNSFQGFFLFIYYYNSSKETTAVP
ncbi:adhesion G-protein coupled receptor G5-like [Labrus mixtus]|uniref:adhesion G-protein coupled receptor G5-like n=1 Tax=Labrus mixtus TaxID=508554 RepID=UPI0029C0E93A|nr:adhesion G-protein coupled receptor G5-like [Labrus mixtus]